MPVITGITGGGTSTAVVRFVDSISTTPVVRFDFNDLEPSMVATIDVTGPPLRFAKSSTMLADGERINASAYGNRTITISAEFASSSEDSASAALSALAQELDRPTNILLVQIGSNPTFFRTYRTQIQTEMLNYDTTYMRVSASIEAEPFGLGLPQFVPDLTLAGGGGNFTRLSNDPAYASTDQLAGRSIDLVNILGDVETPAQILLAPSFSPPGAYGTYVVAVRRNDIPPLSWTLPRFLQAEAYSAGTDTAVASSHDAAMSGTGNNYMRCTFATATNLTHRVGFLWPLASSVEARGSYRLFARVRINGTGTATFAADYNGVQLQPAVSVDVSGNPTNMLDLGTFTAPAGQDPVYNGYSGVQMPIQPTPVWVMAGRTSGSVTVDFDYVIAVPADDALAVVSVGAVAVSTFVVIDGTSDAVFQSATTLDDMAGPSLSPATHSFSGALPMLSPASNRLYLIAPVYDPANPSNDAGNTMSMNVQIRYWPRYLTLATA